jgi:hypothetical protein
MLQYDFASHPKRGTLTSVVMLVFRLVTACELVGRYECLHPEDEGSMSLRVCPHGITTQRTNMDHFTAVRGSDRIQV